MVIEDVYGFPIVHRRINVLEMVCGEKPPSFIQSSCKPAAPSVFTAQLLTYYLLPIAYWKWSMKNLLLSSKVPAIPRLHQCNYLLSSVEKLFVQNTDKKT